MSEKDHLKQSCDLDEKETIAVFSEANKGFAYVETYDFDNRRCCIALALPKLKALISALSEAQKELENEKT